VDLPLIDAMADKQSIELRFPDGWLEANPLTIADLEREQVYLRKVGYELSFS
jgi:exopolyphosphatase/guanosine-5'-triphosphate,3'-diphosphate pyrophosphatase